MTPQEQFAHLMKTDENFRSQVLDIGTELFYCMAKDAVKRGAVIVAGKAPYDAFLDLLEYIRSTVTTAHELVLVTDHRSELLSEAQKAASEDRPLIAIALFATYFEHAINDIILAGCARAKISNAIAQRILRSSSIFEKTGNLISDIGLPALPSDVTKTIRLIAELRNEFVHYKWTGHDDDESRVNQKKISEALGTAPLAIENLKQYEKETLLVGFEAIFEAARNDTLKNVTPTVEGVLASSVR